MDITWRLDHPSQAGGSPYMYVQIRTSSVHVGQHVVSGQFLGYSGWFIEVGLTPDWAYGVSNWRWGVNILRVFPWLQYSKKPLVPRRDKRLFICFKISRSNAFYRQQLTRQTMSRTPTWVVLLIVTHRCISKPFADPIDVLAAQPFWPSPLPVGDSAAFRD